MKKILVFLLTGVMVASLAACGGKNDANTNTEATESVVNTEDNASDSALHSLLGTDVGNEFMLSKEHTREVSEGVGDPCADEGQEVEVLTALNEVVDDDQGHKADDGVEPQHEGRGHVADISLTVGKHGGRQGNQQGKTDHRRQKRHSLRYHKPQAEGDGSGHKIHGG